MITSRNIIRDDQPPRDNSQMHITRRQPAEPAPEPIKEADVYAHVTEMYGLHIVKLRAVEPHTGEIIRSAEYETADYTFLRSFAREKESKFRDSLREDGYTIRR